MRRLRLLWRIYPPFLLITLAALLGATWFATEGYEDLNRDARAADLLARARLIEEQVRNTSLDLGPMSALCAQLSTRSRTRFTVVAPDGTVIGDTHKRPQSMDNHGMRPEILAAFRGEVGRSLRLSGTLEMRMMYVAVPLHDADGDLMCVLRTALPMTDIEEQTRSLLFKFFLGGLGSALLAAIVALGIARRISRPLERIRMGAERFARGDLNMKIDVPRTTEIGALAESLNAMAVQLDEKIRTVIRQRNEQETILESMAEGVVAVDAEQRIININNAAADLMDLDLEQVRGKDIRSVIPNLDFLDFIRRALRADEMVEEEVSIDAALRRRVRVCGSVLRDARGRGIGAVMVLSDVTRLRRLETVRQDFVANVSHEIRTPITSIKGFVETLLGGAKDDPETLDRFLEILQRQADRMALIVEDLLTLSRIEEEGRQGAVGLEEQVVVTVMNSAVEVCSARARERDTELIVECEPALEAPLNGPLLEQALVNLVDNAVKYNEGGGRVHVTAVAEEDRVLISVRDRGRGIASEHLPRLFERFYRVDKARSREMGGTGLGLAIVKHIAHVHGGSVSVESVINVGSTFTIALPARAATGAESAGPVAPA